MVDKNCSDRNNVVVLRRFHRPKISPMEILASWLPYPWTPRKVIVKLPLSAIYITILAMYHQRKKFYCYWLSDYCTVMVTLSAQHFHKVKQELSSDVKRKDNYHMLETFSSFAVLPLK